MAKYTSGDRDPYEDAGTGILKNRLGITNQKDLDRAEADLSAIAQQSFKETPLKGPFDLSRLQAIHKRLFNDVYEWAGELRTVDVSKGHTKFAHNAYIENEAHKLFKKLAAENSLAGTDAATFSDRAGYYLGEINVLHPFREGNGRTQREFVNQLASGAGYQIAWSGVTRDAMIRASILAFNGDHQEMATLIRENLSARPVEITVQQSLQEVNRFASQGRVKIEPANLEHGRYSGEVIHRTQHHIVQSTGQGIAVVHSRSALSPTEAAALTVGQVARVQYDAGRLSVLPARTPSLDRGKSR